MDPTQTLPTFIDCVVNMSGAIHGSLHSASMDASTVLELSILSESMIESALQINAYIAERGIPSTYNQPSSPDYRRFHGNIENLYSTITRYTPFLESFKSLLSEAQKKLPFLTQSVQTLESAFTQFQSGKRDTRKLLLDFKMGLSPISDRTRAISPTKRNAQQAFASSDMCDGFSSDEFDSLAQDLGDLATPTKEASKPASLPPAASIPRRKRTSCGSGPPPSAPIPKDASLVLRYLAACTTLPMSFENIEKTISKLTILYKALEKTHCDLFKTNREEPLVHVIINRDQAFKKIALIGALSKEIEASSKSRSAQHTKAFKKLSGNGSDLQDAYSNYQLHFKSMINNTSSFMDQSASDCPIFVDLRNQSNKIADLTDLLSASILKVLTTLKITKRYQNASIEELKAWDVERLAQRRREIAEEKKS